MKTFLTTVAVIAALATPALAEGDDASPKDSDAKGSVKATTEYGTPGSREDAARTPRAGAPRATTTGAGSASTNKMTPNESEKSTSGSDSGSGGGGMGGGGRGGR